MKYFMVEARGAALRLAAAMALAAALLAIPAVHASAPGITGTGGSANTFALVAQEGYSSQPDGNQIYSWGYGCNVTAVPSNRFVPYAGSCGAMQIPGPTLVVTENTLVTVTLTNKLPVGAGATSILFPGFTVSTSGGQPGKLTQEAVHNASVTYSFTPTKAGTYSYYSGTQGDLQIEMGMYGAVIVLPSTSTGCKKGTYSLAASAYDNTNPSPSSTNPANATCYDREYLFQFAEMDSAIHAAAEAQKANASIVVNTEPYVPNYYLINGRSMPDDMDSNYSPAYPNQPYNANPQVHATERLLMRMIGQGRVQHPFHFHANHARVLARDGNLLLSQTDSTQLAGPLLFTWGTVSGQTVDAMFTWSGKGLNWDVYNHKSGDGSVCIPDANGNYTSNPAAPNFGEYCPDHLKPIPVVPPDAQIVANGAWYAGTPYLGISGAATTALPPAQLELNASGYAYMWHSHDEREITTNDVFPGGMMTMLIVQPMSVTIDETQ